MKFENRQTQFPGRKRVRKLNSNNEQVEEYFVVMENAEGNANPPGTPINSENLEKANWRDDTSISFKMQDDNDLPASMSSGTQIVTTADGRTWLIPPGELDPIEVSPRIDTEFPAVPSDTRIPSTKLTSDLLALKQNTLVAGNGININGNVISTHFKGFPGYLPVFGNPVSDPIPGNIFDVFRDVAGIERNAYGSYMLAGNDPKVSYILTYTVKLISLLKTRRTDSDYAQLSVGTYDSSQTFVGFIDINTPPTVSLPGPPFL